VAELKIDTVIEGYIKLRDKKAAIEQSVKDDIAAINMKLVKIEEYLRNRAEAEGVSSFKTDSGTAYMSSSDYASVADWDAAFAFIKKNEHWEMLTRGVNKVAVREFIKTKNATPPGINFGSKLTVGVRRPTKKA